MKLALYKVLISFSIDVSHESEYIGLGDLHPKITEHNLSDDSEYVGLGDLHHGINEHNASKQKDNEEVQWVFLITSLPRLCVCVKGRRTKNK